LRVQVDGALPALSVATANGCDRLEGGKIQTLWIEQDGDRKRLQLTAVFSRRTDRRERCSPSSRLALLDAGERMASTVRLDERTAIFTLALPAGRERIRVALGADVHLRLDLREATAEQEAFAAASP